MKKDKSYLVVLLFILFCNVASVAAQNEIIPIPLSVKQQSGFFELNKRTTVRTNLKGEERKQMLNFLKESPMHLISNHGVVRSNQVSLLLVNDASNLPSLESYRLSITPWEVAISARGGAGLFYGLQSLMQIAQQHKSSRGFKLPSTLIVDTPRFAYRGFHLDVSRHFFPKEFVMKQLDMMAYYKLNRFHWHLTDAAGWRIEIKKYPMLTYMGAWRPVKSWKEWWKGDRLYSFEKDARAQGGYYTQKDIKEVVAYAKARHITVIPEIEMPGHSEEVLAVYPELSCSGRPYVNSDFCIGNEKTFTFIENVLTEVIALFPSEYIHIGGDEAGKNGWRKCAKCRELMKRENLKDVNQLQSYMIHRVEKFLNSKGRQLLGWDEILEGGLAPNATVMSWRGEDGGIAAVKSGHRAVMTPGRYCYFDAYQDNPLKEPEAIGGYLPIDKVYSYDPVPKELSSSEQKLIEGVQACLWTEYVQTPAHAEYMMYPRLLALAEVAWSAPERKSFPDFRQRALNAVDFLEDKGYNTFPLKNEDGNKPASLKNEEHLAVGKKVVYKNQYYRSYSAGGDSALVDGVRGGWSYGDNRWQGILSKNLDVVIDLAKPTTVSYINAQFMQIIGPSVWMPTKVIIEISDDGINFKPLSKIINSIPKDKEGLIFKDFGWKGVVKTRYVHYVAYPPSMARTGVFIFTDEIVVK